MSEQSSSSSSSFVNAEKASESVRKIKRCRLALESPTTFSASASVARMSINSPEVTMDASSNSSAMDASSCADNTPFKLPASLMDNSPSECGSMVGTALSFSLCSSPSSPSCSSPNLALICTPPALKVRDPNAGVEESGKRKCMDKSPTPKKASFFVGGKENMETPRINNQHRNNVAAAMAAAKNNKRFNTNRKMLGAPKRSLHRSMSVTVPTSTSQASIMRAFSMADSNKFDLTGDKRQQLSLPLLKTGLKHYDLDTIDCHTVARLLNGEYDDKINSYRIIDARYVYEFEGGHIRGAENFGSWDEKVFFDEFLPPTLGPKLSSGHEQELSSNEACSSPSSERRSILIFHCEFSTARGPSLMRELRSRDRSLNEDVYPALHYPECYLLHKGYEAFFAAYPELCEPRSYQTMKDPNFSKEERMFRIKAKSWAAGGAGTIARTGNSSRLLKM